MTRLQHTLRSLSDMRRLYRAMSQARIETPHAHARLPKSLRSSVEAHRRVLELHVSSKPPRVDRRSVA